MKRPPTPRIVLILVVIVALVVIAFLFLSHRSTAVVPPPVSETTPLPPAGQWPSTKVSDQTINDTGSYYTIKATYPVTKNTLINGYFSDFVQTNITQFKSDTSWAADNGADAAPAEADSLSLTITYTDQKNANADNYTFNVDTYTGGAHDLEATQTYSFSATGQLITLASLFTNGDDGLKTIEPYVQTQLGAQQYADSSMIADGTAPTEANYQNFTVSPTGITFIFDPYQVGPYAEGTQTVTVPVSVFKSIANADLFQTN